MNLVPVFTAIHILLYILWLTFFLWLIFRNKFFSIEGISKTQLSVFFLFKVAAGIALTLIYTYYYTDQTKADIYRYFNDSKVISSLLFTHPLVWLKVITGIGIFEPETFQHLLPTLYFSHPETDIATNNTLIIRIASVFNYFSYNNIYTDTLFFNFLSFVGITMLVKTLTKYFKAFPQLLFLPFYLLPSFIFWSSGMLKEQLVFTFLCPAFAIAFSLSTGSRYMRWFLLGFLFYIIYCIKPSVAGCLLVSLLFLPFINTGWWQKIAVAVVCGLLFLNLGNDVCEKLVTKRNEFTALALAESAGSYFDKRTYPVDCRQLVLLMPQALLDSVFRPFVWERGSVFQFLFAIENAILIALLILLLVKHFNKKKDKKVLIAFSFLLFAFLNYLIIGITVPITGAIVHYRIIATPFLVAGVLFFLNHAQLRTFLNRLGIFK